MERGGRMERRGRGEVVVVVVVKDGESMGGRRRLEGRMGRGVE